MHVLNLLFLLETRVFSMTEIGFFGTAVVILLGFRNNEAYRRYWEARTAWGELTNASRYFASEIMGYIQPPRGKEHAAQDGAVKMPPYKMRPKSIANLSIVIWLFSTPCACSYARKRPGKS